MPATGSGKSPAGTGSGWRSRMSSRNSTCSCAAGPGTSATETPPVSSARSGTTPSGGSDCGCPKGATAAGPGDGASPRCCYHRDHLGLASLHRIVIPPRPYPDSRRQARKSVTGLISDLPRKNCWALAEQAGDATPDKMQRLLERAAWDASDAMREIRTFVVSRLGDLAGAVLVLDESGQEKAGEHTAGVKRQYLGCAGRVANGINVVYASYAAPAGHAIIAAPLYVPGDWADDSGRRAAAGIPPHLEFKTKPRTAAQMIKQILAEERCPPWLTGDEVYGRDATLRAFLEERRTGYVLKIPCSFRVTLPAGQKARADHAARLVPARAWQTASAGHGSKGERDYSWAWLGTASARHHLLIRRHLRDHADLAYFLCHVPAGRACSFTTLGRVRGRRV